MSYQQQIDKAQNEIHRKLVNIINKMAGEIYLIKTEVKELKDGYKRDTEHPSSWGE